MTLRRILVTAALPYANGPIHIGHLVEYIQTDIWVRFQRLAGNRCVFVWADDTHGTAIMISAKKAGVSEETFIARMNDEHQRDFRAFQIAYDNYGSTHSPENRRLCKQIWYALWRGGYITEADVSQLYDPVAGTFLADRFVKGTCPKCGAPGQYGDNCEKCSSTYSPTDLIDPISTLSNGKPEIRSAKHLFIQLEKLHGFLNEWTQSGRLQSEVANYLKGHFLGDPLRDWDVSRPAPYFGFEITDSPGNYWYVWFDAPVGYMASLAEWCERTGEKFDDWWPQGPDAESRGPEIHHFIGKDITYFHTLFWPGMLKAAEFKLPTKVHIHGFLTVGGEKMSKSKGTFVKAETYLKHLDPSALRYYYSSKLGSRLDDLDMNLDEFVEKVNSEPFGKVVNLASRCAKYLQETGFSSVYPDDGGLFAKGAAAGREIAEAYEACEYSKAMRMVMELADRANAYIDAQKPWVIAKDAGRAREVQDVCSVGLNLYRQLIVYLAPVLPQLAEQSGELLSDPITGWSQAQAPLTGTKIAPYRHLMKRIERKDVEAMIEDSKDAAAAPVAPAPTTATESDEYLKAEPLAPICTIEDFAKVDLRVARVISAEDVPEADKLLKLTLSLGGEERRTVFAGIKKAYKPEQLIGRQVIVVANLTPRKMKFGLSEGMIVATGPGGADVFLLNADQGAKVGQRVH